MGIRKELLYPLRLLGSMINMSLMNSRKSSESIDKAIWQQIFYYNTQTLEEFYWLTYHRQKVIS